VWFGCDVSKHCSWKKFGLEDLQLYVLYIIVSVIRVASPLEKSGNLTFFRETSWKFDDHVTAVCKSAYYHIRAMHHIRPAITEDIAKSIACALVGSRLYYANSVLLGVSS